jgi:hypothetical protein
MAWCAAQLSRRATNFLYCSENAKEKLLLRNLRARPAPGSFSFIIGVRVILK